jgi:CBS domain-containing protein
VTLVSAALVSDDWPMNANSSAEPKTTGPDTPVQILMTRAVARISPEARLREVAQKLAAMEAGALAVGTTQAIVGIVSERDVTRAYGRSEQPEQLRAGDIASATLIWCPPKATAAEAAQIMCERGIRHLLVGDGELQGIVSARDLLEALVVRS